MKCHSTSEFYFVYYQPCNPKIFLHLFFSLSHSNSKKIPPLTLLFCPCLPQISPSFLTSSLSLSFLQVLSVPHGVLAKLVAELLDKQSQLSGCLRLLFQELVAEAGNVLLDLLQLACNKESQTDRHDSQGT